MNRKRRRCRGAHAHALAECIPHLVWVARPDGALEYLNRRCQEYVGRPLADLVGWDWARVIHPDDLARVMDAWTRALRTGEEFHAEYRLRRHDGAFRWHVARAEPQRGRDGTIRRWFGTCTDIDAQKQAEDALRQREARFRAIIENSYDAVQLLAADGTILYSTPAVVRTGGRTPEELIGRNAFEWSHPDDVAGLREQFGAFLGQPGASLRGESRYRHRDDSWRWVEATCTNLLHDPAVGALVVNFHDVTERKRLEEQLRQAQKMEAVGRLAGGVAHDFNNLLTIINGYSEVVLTGLPAGDPARPLVEQVRQAGERAAGLTRQLLALGRRQILQRKRLDLNAVVAEVGTLLRRMIGEDVALVFRPGPNLPRVEADPGQLEQVLMNLAVNARDAMPTGGRLTIETRNVTHPGGIAQYGSEVQPGPYVALSLSDTGCGMTPDVVAHAFEPFFTTKEPGKGTGLGLATVYGIVKQSGGFAEVESALGRGTTVRIYLPGASAGPAAAEQAAEAPLPRGAETVLVAEDEDGVRTLTRLMLQRLGYTVLTAASAEEAVALCRQSERPVDLLLTDVVMPGESGRAAAEGLQAEYPRLRVLFMSGYTDDAVVRHGVAHDRANFLQKPFTPAALARKVREVLDADVRSEPEA